MNNSPTPQSPRRFMDFAPSRRMPSSGRPAQPARPVSRPTPRPVSHPVSHPVMSRPTPMSRPVARPAQAQRLATPRPQTHMVHEHIEATTVYYPSAKPTRPKLVAEDDFLDIETSGLGIIEDLGPTSRSASRDTTKVDAPDNNSYSLGGQSPFINTDKVDKRPLSSHLPKNKPAKKNVYAKSDKLSDKKSRKSARLGKSTPTVVTGTASRGNSISLAIAIILTVILGAIVGTVAYLAFFQ